MGAAVIYIGVYMGAAATSVVAAAVYMCPVTVYIGGATVYKVLPLYICCSCLCRQSDNMTN